MNWFTGLLLVLHIGGAIIAFGPTFTFPIIGAMGGAEPMHSNFALRINERIEERLVIPLALFQAVTGVLLIWTVGLNVFVHLWLLLGIVLYVIAHCDLPGQPAAGHPQARRGDQEPPAGTASRHARAVRPAASHRGDDPPRPGGRDGAHRSPDPDHHPDVAGLERVPGLGLS